MTWLMWAGVIAVAVVVVVFVALLVLASLMGGR